MRRAIYLHCNACGEQGCIPVELAEEDLRIIDLIVKALESCRVQIDVEDLGSYD